MLVWLIQRLIKQICGVRMSRVNHLNLIILRLSKYANCTFKIKYRNTNSIF